MRPELPAPDGENGFDETQPPATAPGAAWINRRSTLRGAGIGALGALTGAAFGPTRASADSTTSQAPIWAPLVGTWLLELHLDIPGLGTGNNEMAIWFLPGGMAMASSVWGTPDFYGNPTLQLGAQPGAWTVLDLSRNQYRYRMSPVVYYPSAQNPFQPTGGVARIHTSTVDLQLSADHNSFVSFHEDAIVYWYDSDGKQIAPPSPFHQGQVSRVTGMRITTDFVPPAQFPFGTP